MRRLVGVGSSARLLLPVAVLVAAAVLVTNKLAATADRARLEVIVTANAPKPVGPYSQAIIVGGTIYGSGQLGIDPATGRFAANTAEGQTEQAIRNMDAVLRQAGSDLSRVAKVTIYLKDLKEFSKVNAVYAKMFGNHKPARSTLQVAAIPLDGLVEIDYIAAR